MEVVEEQELIEVEVDAQTLSLKVKEEGDKLRMANLWKTTAIIFIILFLIETIGVIFLFQLGMETIEKENECAYNICNEYDSYAFDSYNNMCYCYENHEIVYEQFIR